MIFLAVEIQLKLYTDLSISSAPSRPIAATQIMSQADIRDRRVSDLPISLTAKLTHSCCGRKNQAVHFAKRHYVIFEGAELDDSKWSADCAPFTV